MAFTMPFHGGTWWLVASTAPAGGPTPAGFNTTNARGPTVWEPGVPSFCFIKASCVEQVVLARAQQLGLMLGRTGQTFLRKFRNTSTAYDGGWLQCNCVRVHSKPFKLLQAILHGIAVHNVTRDKVTALRAVMITESFCLWCGTARRHYASDAQR